MISRPPSTAEDATPFVPRNTRATLAQLDRAAQKCRGCDLYRHATQAVFGEIGSAQRNSTTSVASKVLIMLVGEQPGDQEDQQGRPFVGPAGKLLDRALADADIERATTYVTNAVKHFKWAPTPRGNRRLHQKPTTGEVLACRPWLQRELMLVQPRVIVCLGATAARSLLGPAFKVSISRGKKAEPTADLLASAGYAKFMATVHPSSLLRLPDRSDRERAYKDFVRDLRAAATLASM